MSLNTFARIPFVGLLLFTLGCPIDIVVGQEDPDLVSSVLDLDALGEPLTRCTEDGWCIERPTSPFHTIWDIDAIDDESVWAVGERGMILHFDGADWAKRQVKGNRFRHVFAASKNDVWMAGVKEDEIGKSAFHFDGTALSRIDISGAVPYQFFGSGPQDVWALFDDAALAVGSCRHFDGSQWSSCPGVAATGIPVGDVEFFRHPRGAARGPGDVFVASPGGGLYHYSGDQMTDLWSTSGAPNGAQAPDLVTIAADGSVWIAGRLGELGSGSYAARFVDDGWTFWEFPTAVSLQDIAADSADKALMVSGLSLWHFDGALWTQEQTYGGLPHRLAAVGDDFLIADRPGRIFRREASGWALLIGAASTEYLSTVHITDGATLAGGLKYGAMTFDDETWTETPGPANDGNIDIVEGPSGDVYSISAGGTLRRFNGATWDSLATLPGEGGELAILDDGTILHGGCGLHRLAGDESSWEPIAVPTEIAPNVFGCSPEVLNVAGRSLSDLWLRVSDDSGLTLAQEDFAHFDGSTWTRVPFIEDLQPHSLTMSASGIAYSESPNHGVYRYVAGSWEDLGAPTSVQSSCPNLGASGSITGRHLAIVDDDDIFLFGLGGRVVHYDGTTWEREDAVGCFRQILDLHATSEQAVLVGSDGLIATRKR